jgi:hypothetical protein
MSSMQAKPEKVLALIVECERCGERNAEPKQYGKVRWCQECITEAVERLARYDEDPYENMNSEDV